MGKIEVGLYSWHRVPGALRESKDRQAARGTPAEKGRSYRPRTTKALPWTSHPADLPADCTGLCKPGDRVDTERRRNKREQDQSEKVSTPIRVPERKPPEYQERQEKKCMQMKQRHRAVEQPFDPGRNTLFFAALQQSGFPMMQQKYPGRNRVEQSALRDEQCQRNRLPCNVGLAILQRK